MNMVPLFHNGIQMTYNCMDSRRRTEDAKPFDRIVESIFLNLSRIMFILYLEKV